MIRLIRAGYRWEVTPAFAPCLETVLEAPGDTVKESPVKLVTRHTVDSGVYYLKRYRHDRVLLRPYKYLFKASQARQEWRLSSRLAELGIPVVPHLAHGERWSAGGLRESVLITRAFAGQPADEASNVSLEGLLHWVQSLHDRGVLQRDLHPGNILVSSDGAEFCLVDLHGTQIKPWLHPAERAENLANLRIFLSLPVEPEVEALSERRRREHYARRSWRCLKHNREFIPRRYGRMTWRVRKPYLTPALEAILADPDGFLARRATILKPGRSATVGKADGWVLKRHNLRKWTSLAKDLFRRSRAYRAMQRAYHLELVGIKTARPIAAAERRIFRFLVRSYFVMEEIPEARDLREWPGGKGMVIDRIARLIARLHEEGFSHRDLKETNIVIDAKEQALLLDLEGLVYIGTVSGRRAAADLGRLARGAASLPQYQRSDRVRFLHQYCRARKLRPSQLRRAS
jgi:tRNA A-37 threonylcarbamoyl transferase component Bud32